jgi:hypothetical protein
MNCIFDFRFLIFDLMYRYRGNYWYMLHHKKFNHQRFQLQQIKNEKSKIENKLQTPL